MTANNMNIIECNTTNIKQYELDIWGMNKCINLCSLKQNSNGYFFDCSGLTRVSDYMKSLSKSSVTDSFYSALSIIRKTIEAKLAVSKYLINESSICLEPEMLWMNSEKRIVFSPEYSGDDFFERICKLAACLGYPEVAEKLKEENCKRIMNEKDILSFLSSWELELR